MLAALAGLFSSATLGGITGLLGGAVSRVTDYFTLKQQNSHELAMRDKDLAIAQVEAQKELAIAQDANYTAREVAENAAMSESFKADKATYLDEGILKDCAPWTKSLVAAMFGFVDFVRGLTRPGLTLYLVVLTTLMYYQMTAIVSKSGQAVFQPEDAVKIIFIIVDTVLYLASMSTGWWFATRAKEPPKR